MSIENTALAGAKWLWEKYGKEFVDKAGSDIKQKWNRVKWPDAEAKYRARLLEQHSHTKLLGHPRPIVIADIFTGVFILDQLTAFKHYDLSDLRRRPLDRKMLRLDSERRNAIEVILSGKNLYVLGKPGSGKTTLLKYIVLQACNGNIPKTPVFISLQEWASSGQELLSFIEHQFDICGFPNARPFVEELCKKGNAIVLFDALDEVRQEQQQKIIGEIKTFAHKYPDVQICVTCRIAATEYIFENFTSIEVADFSNSQIQNFIYRWYDQDEARSARLLFELAKPENQGLQELTPTPLLLALLCLVFDEIGYFPKRRVDLYKEATDALLKKWDASRGIERDAIYHKLSLNNKKKLLMQIAYKYFEKGVYFIGQDELGREIATFTQKLSADDHEMPDGEAILRAIEAQHGFLVQRGRGIYSFLHLTFQEYFTALHIVDNMSNEAMTNLFKKRLNDKRWDEIFLVATSLVSA